MSSWIAGSADAFAAGRDAEVKLLRADLSMPVLDEFCQGFGREAELEPPLVPDGGGPPRGSLLCDVLANERASLMFFSGILVGNVGVGLY